MEPDLFRYDDPPGFKRKKTNYFAWTIFILLLIGLVLAAWLGSFYILGQPERPESYRILQKLHKIETPKRFALTAAPPGEFLNPKQLYDRYAAMGPAELARKDAELTRNYIRNFQQVHGLVTYVVGRFNIMAARQLTEADIFHPGVVALARAVEQPALLMEHVFTTANEHDAKLFAPMLAMGMDVNFERSHDLSAIVHVERLPDGRIQISAIPLLYGSYAVTRGTGTFSLEPPEELNLAAGWPLFKTAARHAAEIRYDSYRERLAPASNSLPIVGLPAGKTAPPPEDALVRVEAAVPLETASPAPEVPLRPAHRGQIAKAGKLSKNGSAASPAPPPLVRRAEPVSDAETNAAAANDTRVATATSATATPRVMKALPVDNASPGVVIASTTGATWKTFAPGNVPAGRVLDANGLREVASNGTRGERVYLRGEFVVNFADGNRAVLRPTNGGSAAFAGARKARVIVDYPAGSTVPEAGTTLDRDASRPFEVTEVREQSDGQLNVFVREIIKH